MLYVPYTPALAFAAGTTQGIRALFLFVREAVFLHIKKTPSLKMRGNQSINLK